jgi:nitrous oxidase accessory protein
VLLYLISVFFSMVPLISTSSPLDSTVVRLDPATIELGPEYCVDETFTLAAKIDDVEYLTGVGIQIKWDITYIEHVEHIVKIPIEDYPDGVLHGTILQVADKVDEKLGTYDCAAVSLAGPTFNGSGTIFEITFRVNHQPAALEPDVHFQVKYTLHDLADLWACGGPPHYLEHCNVTIKAQKHIAVPDNFPKIQEAINNASNGDLILVSEGSYIENIVVNKSVALIAKTQNVIIRSQNDSNCAVLVQADNVAIIGFKIECSLLAYTGIILDTSSYTTITGNFLDTALGEGIKVKGGSGNKIIRNEIATCTHYGITLIDTQFNLIMGNSMNCHENSIHMIRSQSNYIYDNYLAVHQGTIPISMSLSNQNTVEGNTLWNDDLEREAYIGLYNSNNNLLFHNNLFHTTGAILDGNNMGNLWDNEQEGNYWYDYAGNDSDGDGIGDNPIIFDEYNVDNYPLMNTYSRWNTADVNFDFAINIFDAVLACVAYGSNAADSRWNPYIDLVERYGFIDISDITLICSSYGEEHTP